MTTHLIIPDAHVKPDSDFSRFDILGMFIADLRPDTIICLGDFADMESLCSYDKGKKSFEGRRYQKDLQATIYAMSRVLMYIDKLNSKIKDTKKKLYKPRLVMCIGNHECYSRDTEVLTAGGWTKIEDVKVGDLVYTLGGWEKTTAIHSYPFNGLMHNYKSDRTDLLVTPNHRMYYYTSSGKLTSKESKYMPSSFDIPVSTKVTSGEMDLSPDELFLYAGLCTDSYHGNKYPVLYQSGEKATVVRDTLNRLGIPFTERKRDRDTTEICGRKLIHKPKTSYEFYLQQNFIVDNNKVLPEFVYDLSCEDFDIFLEALCFFDGTKTTKGNKSKVFYGKKEMCDSVQESCIQHGYAASITEYRTNQFRVNITKTNKSRVNGYKSQSYNDNVYCVTVPKNENILVRRNGKACFSGNSRINRAIQDNAELEGTMSIDDLQYKQLGWEVVPYESTITIDGITYAHTFVKGYRPVSGVNHARALINKGHCSCTCGHSHLRSFAEDVTWEGRRVLGLVAGCYTDEYQNYAAQDNNYWWSGLVVKRNVKDGVYEPQFVSLDMLKEVYGKKKQLKHKPIRITKEMILNFERS